MIHDIFYPNRQPLQRRYLHRTAKVPSLVNEDTFAGPQSYLLDFDRFSFHPKYVVTLLPLRGVLTTSTYPGRCPGLCSSAPSGRTQTLIPHQKRWQNLNYQPCHRSSTNFAIAVVLLHLFYGVFLSRFTMMIRCLTISW